MHVPCVPQNPQASFFGLGCSMCHVFGEIGAPSFSLGYSTPGLHQLCT
jgi:cytochrome c5